MVEPFGCVVMLHWRLPRLRSSHFQLPFPSGFSSILFHRNISLSLSLFRSLTRSLCADPLSPPESQPLSGSPLADAYSVQPSAKRLKRNVIIRQCIIIAFDELGNCIILNETLAAYFFYASRVIVRTVAIVVFIY